MTEVLVVPTAPALLTSVAPELPMDVPEAWGALRRRVHDVLGGVGGATTVLSLVAGDETRAANGGVADLRPYGVPGQRSTHRGNHEVAALLHDALDVATPTTDDAHPRTLPLDTVVHVRLATEHGARSVVAVEVGPDRIDDVARALDAALPHDDVVVLVQGDLASSPIRRTDSDRGTEATAWDERAVPLLRTGDVAAWRALDPGDVEPRGLAPLAVALTWLGDRWDGSELTVEAPRGIGAVTGRVASLR